MENVSCEQEGVPIIDGLAQNYVVHVVLIFFDKKTIKINENYSIILNNFKAVCGTVVEHMMMNSPTGVVSCKRAVIGIVIISSYLRLRF